jgi:hypothetical protein
MGEWVRKDCQACDQPVMRARLKGGKRCNRDEPPVNLDGSRHVCKPLRQPPVIERGPDGLPTKLWL